METLSVEKIREIYAKYYDLKIVDAATVQPHPMLDEILIEQARFTNESVVKWLVPAWYCPPDCKYAVHASGPWDNPHDGGCAREEEMPNHPDGLTFENKSTLPLCPLYGK